MPWSSCCLPGKLGTIQGTVVRMSHIRPLIVRMDFACKCGEVMTCDLPDGKYVPPTKCAGEMGDSSGNEIAQVSSLAWHALDRHAQ